MGVLIVRILLFRGTILESPIIGNPHIGILTDGGQVFNENSTVGPQRLAGRRGLRAVLQRKL